MCICNNLFFTSGRPGTSPQLSTRPGPPPPWMMYSIRWKCPCPVFRSCPGRMSMGGLASTARRYRHVRFTYIHKTIELKLCESELTPTSFHITGTGVPGCPLWRSCPVQTSSLGQQAWVSPRTFCQVLVRSGASAGVVPNVARHCQNQGRTLK